MFLENRQVFCNELDKILEKLAREVTETLRGSPALQPPKYGSNYETRLDWSVKGFEELFLSVLISPYLKGELKGLFDFQLELSLRKIYQSKPFLLELYVQNNKVYNVLFIMEHRIWLNEREFFGFIFSTRKNYNPEITWKQWLPRKPSYSMNRIRGYRDHGTLKPQHYPEPRCSKKNFQSFIREYEDYQKFIKDTLPGLIEGWIT